MAFVVPRSELPEEHSSEEKANRSRPLEFLSAHKTTPQSEGPAPVFPFAFGVAVGITLMRIAALSCREKAEVTRLAEAAVAAAERAEASAAAAAAAAGYAEVAESAAAHAAETAASAAANAAAAGQSAEDAADSASLAAAKFPSSHSLSQDA
jgi:hypothetical protein